jgi:hypothetical protein
MTGFLAELGQKLADRWVALLVLPGLLFTGVAALAATLGQRHWADTTLAWQRLGALTTVGSRQDGLVRTAVLLVVVLLVATASGMVAQALGKPVEYVFLGRWPVRVARRPTERRRQEWQRHADAYKNTGEVAEALGRNRIALARPVCPTWTGDRMHAPAARVLADYGLDLSAAWPRLWLLLPDSTRAPLTESRRRFDEAMVLGGWSVLYLVVAGFWWPSALVAIGVGLVAWRRGRATADVYAELVESTVDVHLDDLLDRFADETRPVSPQRGRAVSERFRKGT